MVEHIGPFEEPKVAGEASPLWSQPPKENIAVWADAAVRQCSLSQC